MGGMQKAWTYTLPTLVELGTYGLVPAKTLGGEHNLFTNYHGGGSKKAKPTISATDTARQRQGGQLTIGGRPQTGNITGLRIPTGGQ